MLKLEIRQDDQAGMVRACFAALDSSRREEVATISLALVDSDRKLFEAWKQALTDALVRLLEGAGYTVESVTQIRPHEEN